MWKPTHIRLTVHKARDLKIKGKAGTNDSYVVIGLGHEKHQTSVKERAANPEWNEDCDLCVPSEIDATLKLKVYHRNFFGLSDEHLGETRIPLNDLNCYERPRTRWFSLRSSHHGRKSTDEGQGEIQLTFKFMVQSLHETITEERPKLRKSVSFRAAANQFGEKLSLRRSSKGEVKLGNLTDLAHQEKISHSMVDIDIRAVPANFNDLYWKPIKVEKSPERSPSPQSLPDKELSEQQDDGSCHSINIKSQRHSVDSSFFDSETISNQEQPDETPADNEDVLSEEIMKSILRPKRSQLISEHRHTLGHIECTDLPTYIGVQDRKLGHIECTDKPTFVGVHDREEPNQTEIDAENNDRNNFNTYDKQELIQLILDQRSWIRSRETYLRDLEEYIDTLLVRVIDSNSTLLQKPYENSRQATKSNNSTPFHSGRESIAKKWLSALFKRSS